jgi:hypothetical protein
MASTAPPESRECRDLPVPRGFDRGIKGDQQRTVTGGHDAAMQRQITGLELLERGRSVAEGQALIHLVQVGGGRPGHHQDHRRGLEQAPDRHDVGRGKICARWPARGATAQGPACGVGPTWQLSRPRTRTQERTPADFAGDPALRFQQGKRVAHGRPGHAKVDAELALRRQPGATVRPGVLRAREDQLGQGKPALGVPSCCQQRRPRHGRRHGRCRHGRCRHGRCRHGRCRHRRCRHGRNRRGRNRRGAFRNDEAGCCGYVGIRSRMCCPHAYSRSTSGATNPTNGCPKLLLLPYVKW